MSSNRISTGMMYSQSVNNMLGKQAKISHLEQQLASGKRLVTAADDPVASGTAVNLDRAVAELARFGDNANNIQNRLGLQENALSQTGDLMARVNDLTVQANSSALTNDDRKAIASELKSLHASLLSLSNSTDGSGRYLFGGTADASAPFAVVDGKVVYSGDQTQRSVEVAPDTQVADALPGSEIFMRIRTGDGTVDAHAASGNTGTGLLLNFSRDAGSGSWNGGSYSVAFTAADAYEVRDGSGAVVKTGTYKAGEDISFAGLKMRVDGAPAVGDSFQIGASTNKDVFSTITNLVNALSSDPVTAADKAALQNTLQSSMRDIGQASAKMIDARAAGGAQLAAIDNAAELRASNEVTLKTTLSSLRDLDYADAIGQYQLEQAALKAAQTIFTQMQSMSLFNKLG
ncbi:flagellar hook-associated protein FlgL [Xanthomonas theicola]|uniref:Flagellar hook-associated protein 3 n=1 Tax=Xanthomonas theicola TaxID=56464 RepID=A0A2S6ZE93_9XANT|nr:flagellar hook-associated protein FlgL [Xanthomonas theicola]PPT90581.1 flagellar hook-associated protein 3 [Xanthomonas theicola]QNH24124.1 flagellar hook-associated protein FlgL [Xanthomonas theicola]